MIKRRGESLGSQVQAVFQQSRDTYGYPVPSSIASHLTPQGHPLNSHIQQEMLNFPSNSFLFWGDQNTIKKILKRGDAVAIWTDEYVQRVYSSGLQQLQKHGDISFILGLNKDDIIPQLFTHARSVGVHEIVIIDDQLEKLQKVQAHKGEYPDIAVRLIFVSKQKREKKQQDAYGIEKIRHVRATRRIARELSDGKRLWVFDFNGTLVNREAYERNLERKVCWLVRRGRVTS